MKLHTYLKSDLVKIAALIIVLISVITIFPANATCVDLYTVNATNVTTSSADLNMVSNISQNVWFEFGIVSGSYTMKTGNISATTTNVSKTIKGGYYFPGETYYFRAACYNCSGNEYNFTASAATPVPTQTFSAYATELVDADWNISALVPVVGGPYEDAFAALGAPPMFFYALVWIFILAGMWVRQENMLIPVMMFILLLPVVAFSGFLPGQWVNIGYLIVVVSIAAMLYYFFKGRQ